MSLNSATASTQRWRSITEREVQTLSLIGQGLSSQEAADALDIGKRTVDCRLRSVYSKLHVKNRVQAFQVATQLGLIKPDQFLSASSQPASIPVPVRLTRREIEVLNLIFSRGLSSKEAARVLGCAKTTVDFHLCHIYRKLGPVHNHLQALRVARGLGLIKAA